MVKIGDVGFKFQNCLLQLGSVHVLLELQHLIGRHVRVAAQTSSSQRMRCLPLNKPEYTRSRGERKTRRHEANSGTRWLRTVWLGWESGCVPVRSAQWWPSNPDSQLQHREACT